MALKRGIVRLDEYNPKWHEEYETEEELLKQVLKDKIIEIYHIGSTSIPGLKAKPIIDILMVINSLDEIDEIEKLLSCYDYHNHGPAGIGDRFFFDKGPDEAKSIYIHITTKYSDTYYNQLYFKKYLIEHPEYISKYCTLKEELAQKYADDRKSYTASKDEFIKEVINLAKDEYKK